MVKINTDHLKELAETMDLIAQHQLDKASQIYYCVVKSVDDNQCTIAFNNKQYTVPYYGGKPTPNKTYAIFLPHNNMNESFVIGDGKDGGIGEEVVPISKGGTGADNAADARDNLGLGNAATEDIVPISEGGTGADNAADARGNLFSFAELSKPYTSQSYVTQTAWERCYFALYGDILWAYFNIQLSSSPGTTFRTIGQIGDIPTGKHIFSGASVVIPAQSTGVSNLLLSVSANGTVSIYSAGTASGFYRTVVPFVLVDD